MGDTYRLRITPAAAVDLKLIFDYIHRDSPQNARQIIRRILAAVDSLEILPHRYPIIDDSLRLLGEELRSMPVRPYMVRYRVDDVSQTVTVVGVRHGARK